LIHPFHSCLCGFIYNRTCSREVYIFRRVAEVLTLCSKITPTWSHEVYIGNHISITNVWKACNFVSSWYGWKIAHLALNNNPSLLAVKLVSDPVVKFYDNTLGYRLFNIVLECSSCTQLLKLINYFWYKELFMYIILLHDNYTYNEIKYVYK
jgi:hypothetical protein